jgi:hypothetical protein
MSNRTKVVGQQVVTTPEVRTKRINLGAAESQTVCSGPALLRGLNVNTTLSAHQVSILNGAGGNAEDTIPAESAGPWLPYGDVYYPDGIYLSIPSGASGNISVKFIPLGSG